MESRDTDLLPTVFDDEEFRMYFWRQRPDVWWWSQGDTVNLSAPDGSWAQVQAGSLLMIGPRDLWNEAEQAHARWIDAGRPPLSTWTVQVTADGGTQVELP